MALIRANNKTIQNVTTLPSGITEYNLSAEDFPVGTVIQTIRESEGTINPANGSYTTIISQTFTTKGTNSDFVMTFSGRTAIWYLSGNGRLRGTVRIFDTTANATIREFEETFQIRNFNLSGTNEYAVPFTFTAGYFNTGNYAAGTSVTFKAEAKKLEDNNFLLTSNEFVIYEIAG